LDREERNRTPAVALTTTTGNNNSTPAAPSTVVENDDAYDDAVGPSAMANAVVAVVAPLPAVAVDEENSNSNLSEPALVNLATEPSYQEVNESTPPEERPPQPQHGGGGAGDANPNLKAKPDTKVNKKATVLIRGTRRILCPFAAYYLRYAVRSFFTMSRSFLNSGTLIVSISA
jgi:hypothetical protein